MTDYCLGVLDPAQRSILSDFWKRFPDKQHPDNGTT